MRTLDSSSTLLRSPVPIHLFSACSSSFVPSSSPRTPFIFDLSCFRWWLWNWCKRRTNRVFKEQKAGLVPEEEGAGIRFLERTLWEKEWDCVGCYALSRRCFLVFSFSLSAVWTWLEATILTPMSPWFSISLLFFFRLRHLCLDFLGGFDRFAALLSVSR